MLCVDVLLMMRLKCGLGGRVGGGGMGWVLVIGVGVDVVGLGVVLCWVCSFLCSVWLGWVMCRGWLV